MLENQNDEFDPPTHSLSWMHDQDRLLLQGALLRDRMKLTVRLNQIFSRLNTEHQWTTIPEYGSSLFFSRDSRMAN